MSIPHPVRLDARGRLMLSPELVAEAGLGEDADLVAYSEQGCIVIPTRARLLSSVQEMFRAARGQGQSDPAEELLAERTMDGAAQADRFPR